MFFNRQNKNKRRFNGAKLLHGIPPERMSHKKPDLDNIKSVDNIKTPLASRGGPSYETLQGLNVGLSLIFLVLLLRELRLPPTRYIIVLLLTPATRTK